MRTYDESTIQEIKKSVAHCCNIGQALNELTKKLDLNRDHVRRLNRQYGFWGRQATIAPKVVSEDRTEVIETTEQLTLEQVESMCKVDKTQWEVGSMGVTHGTRGNTWRVGFRRKKVPVDLEWLTKGFIEAATKHAPKSWGGVKPANKSVAAGRLLEVACFDVHVGRLCWGQETGGADYDSKIAPQRVNSAIDELVASAQGLGISRVLLPIGNDLINSEATGMTTHGTPQSQSEDSRWKKTFLTACKLMTDQIEKLASIYPVDVVVCVGNHDQHGSFYLGEYVSAWFRSHPNVTVNNGPKDRKYYQFGQTLIGFTHGNEEKVSALPLLMADECKNLWSQTKYREWHLGHEHRSAHQSIGSCKVRHIGSLVPPDDWMVRRGYVGGDESAEAFVFDGEKGLVASFYYRV